MISCHIFISRPFQTNLLRLGQLQATSLGQLAGQDAPRCTEMHRDAPSFLRMSFSEVNSVNSMQEQPISAVLQRNWLEPCPQHWLSGCQNMQKTVCIETGRSTITYYNQILSSLLLLPTLFAIYLHIFCVCLHEHCQNV